MLKNCHASYNLALILGLFAILNAVLIFSCAWTDCCNGVIFFAGCVENAFLVFVMVCIFHDVCGWLPWCFVAFSDLI